MSSVSRLNANVAVGDPVEIKVVEGAIHEATQIMITGLHPMPFVSNVMFTLFAKEIMSKLERELQSALVDQPILSLPTNILHPSNVFLLE